MIGPVYFVTDPDGPLPVVDQALAAARGGAQTIQLRNKTASDDEMTQQALTLKQLLAPFDVTLVINDRVEAAIASAADGLHIGQGDGDPTLIRQRIGPGMILGLSLESESQLDAVPPAGVDYLGVGPIRATATKPDHAPPIGFDGLARITARTQLPCVAIGGIGLGDAQQLRAAGAAGIAVVSAISRAASPEQAARWLLEEWETA